jgi:hypothetical protein
MLYQYDHYDHCSMITAQELELAENISINVTSFTKELYILAIYTVMNLQWKHNYI